ncbi:MAG: hypothetical protein ACRYGR_01440 [Janthinobacterium lividum]
MSKTIFITLLSLVAVAACNGVSEIRQVDCFREMYDLEGKSSSALNFSFKYRFCTINELKFLKNHATEIANSGMTKKNPAAFGDHTLAQIVADLNKDNCYISASGKKDFRIAFQKSEHVRSYVSAIFQESKGAKDGFALNYAATGAATEKTFHVVSTNEGPVKMSSKDNSIIEDKYCSPQPKMNDIDESTEDDMEESGFVGNNHKDTHNDVKPVEPEVKPVEPQPVQPVQPVQPTAPKTLAELNTQYMAEQRAVYHKRFADEDELTRLAEVQNAKAAKEAVELQAAKEAAEKQAVKEAEEKEKRINDEDDEIYKRAMAHLAEADLHGNKLAQKQGENIHNRLVEEQEQREISARILAEEAEILRKKQEKVQKQRLDHKEMMQAIQKKNDAIRQNNAGNKSLNKLKRTVGNLSQQVKNRRRYINKTGEKKVDQFVNNLDQLITNAENREEKEALLARKHQIEQNYIARKQFKNEGMRFSHIMKMREIQRAQRAKASGIRNENFAKKMAKFNKAKTAAARHQYFVDKLAAKEHNRKTAKLEAHYKNQMTEQKVNAIRAKTDADRQGLRDMMKEGKKYVDTFGRGADMIGYVPAPHKHVGMDMDMEMSSTEESYPFNDDETPANGMLGGWGNWHECTNEEKDITRNYFAMMFAQLRIHNIAVYAQNMMKCKQQVVAGKNYEVKLGFNQMECNVKFHFDIQGIIHDISGNVSQDAKSCVALYAYPFNAEATA